MKALGFEGYLYEVQCLLMHVRIHHLESCPGLQSINPRFRYSGR